MYLNTNLRCLFACLFIAGLTSNILVAQVWFPTNGPDGGTIEGFALHPADSSIMYAVGRRDGILVTEDYGASWRVLPFGIEVWENLRNVAVSNPDSIIILCSSNNDLIKSSDGGLSWKTLENGFNWDNKYHHVLEADPDNPAVFYTAGGSHNYWEVPPTVYMTDDFGETWNDIGTGLSLPVGVFINNLEALGNGKVIIGVNDEIQTNWGLGKVFLTENYGSSWTEVDYNLSDNRYIWSIHACHYDRDHIWITESPGPDQPWLEQPELYHSPDGGASWQTHTYNYWELQAVGSSEEGSRIYFTNGGELFVSNNNGASLEQIPFPDDLINVGINRLYVQINNPSKIFVTMHGEGLIFSPDEGQSWEAKNKGLSSTYISHIAVHPTNSGKVYAVSQRGAGIFRSSDYGNTWERLPWQNINLWPDELVIDPVDPANLWYVGDAPSISVSSDGGEHWNQIHNTWMEGSLTFSSIMAMDQPHDEKNLYVANRGFGIFKGYRDNDETGGYFWWRFRDNSGVDYTRTIETDPRNDQIVYAGYACKPFEDTAYIRASYDDGENWSTIHTTPGSRVISCIEVDPTIEDRVLAASAGEQGIIWESENNGMTWSNLNPRFNFTFVHAFAGQDMTAYAATRGGGVFRTTDAGSSWEKLPGEECTFASSLATGITGPEEIYMGSEISPVLHKSSDGGLTWDTLFNGGIAYSTILDVIPDDYMPGDVYISMKSSGSTGTQGDLVRVHADGSPEVLTNGLPRAPLKIIVSAWDSLTLYAVLLESGIFRSDDGGWSWSDISSVPSGLPGSGFNNLYEDPWDPSSLYAIGGSDMIYATGQSSGMDPDEKYGVYRSLDGGDNWENLNKGELGSASGSVNSLSFYQSDSLIYLYAATDRGIYFMESNGNSWTRDPDLPYESLNGLIIRGDTVYAFTQGAGVYNGNISGDFSISWDQSSGFRNEVLDAIIVRHPSDTTILYMASYPGGIFQSDDKGLSWHSKNFGLPGFSFSATTDSRLFSWDIYPPNPATMYLGVKGLGVYRSDNGGDTWHSVSGFWDELAGAEITSIVSGRTDPDLVYAGTRNGLYRSENGGITWSEHNPGTNGIGINSLAMTPAGTLYAGTAGYGLYSLEEGAWKFHAGTDIWGGGWPQWNWRPYLQNTSLLIHPADNQRILLGTFPQGIYVTEDGGITWKESNTGYGNSGTFSLVSHPEDPEVIFAGTSDGIRVSRDFGRTWSNEDTGWPEEQWVLSIDFDPRNPDVMYACSQNGQNYGNGEWNFRGTVMKSSDGGSSWVSITNGINTDQPFYKIICDGISNDVVYLVSNYEGIYRSVDGGNNWTEFNSGLGERWPGRNQDNATDPMALSPDNAVLYYGTAGAGVYRTLFVPILSVQELEAVKTGNHIRLDWYFTDVADNFSSFNLYRNDTVISDLSGASYQVKILDPGARSFIDTTVTQEGVYYYAVAVENSDGYETEDYPTVGPVGVLLNNHAPELMKDLLNLYVRAGEFFDYTIPKGSFIDPDQDELVYTVVELGTSSLPGWLQFDMETMSFSGTPGLGDVGAYDILVTVTDPVEASVSDIFTIFVRTDITGMDPDREVLRQPYPNPAGSFFILDGVSLEDKPVVVLYDLMARKVISSEDFSVSDGQRGVLIDVSGIKNGMYLVVVKSKTCQFSKRIIVQH
jgi:photosystem II stability/assembly factor-like uncharacterized protein